MFPYIVCILPRFFFVFVDFLYSYFSFSLIHYVFITSSSLIGGGKEVRTPDPLLAKQVLSQLSYTPN